MFGVRVLKVSKITNLQADANEREERRRKPEGNGK